MHAWLGLGHSGHACLPACPVLLKLHRAQHYLHACKGSWKDAAACMDRRMDRMDACRFVCTAVKRGAGANDSGGRMHAGMA